MLRDFITQNRTELIERCRARVGARRAPRATLRELEHGVPTFIDQLARMLPDATHAGDAGWGPDGNIGRSATRHGAELLREDFSIDQVVHDYGDLCQAITELALERGAPISVTEFGVLNRNLDDAIASAVVEWSRSREAGHETDRAADTNVRLGSLGHELRNRLNTAILAIAAIKGGGVGFGGATAAALDRSLIAMRGLIDRTLAEVRLGSQLSAARETIEMASFIADAQVAGALEATSCGCDLTVLPVQRGLLVRADRHILAAALANLLQNAFKYTHEHGHVTLRCYAMDRHVLVEVEDECGGLPHGDVERLFAPLERAGADGVGMGLGLAISRKGVEADGGRLWGADLPGRGCVFTIEMPCANPAAL